MLAAQMVPKYRYENCAIVALNDGGVMVGAQIAKQLHCVLTLLLSAEIKLPREPTALAGITPEGTFSYNHKYSNGEIDEMVGEYRGFIEQEKMQQIHQLNKLLGDSGVMNKELLRGNNVILVSDGFKDAFTLDLAYEFLKPIQTEKLIIAAPFASVDAVDKMHVMADEIFCLNVIAEYMDTDHYYDIQDVPSHEAIIETIEKIVLEWE